MMENSKCKICKNYRAINIKNFQKEIQRDNSIFLLLIKDIKELN